MFSDKNGRTGLPRWRCFGTDARLLVVTMRWEDFVYWFAVFLAPFKVPKFAQIMHHGK